MGSEKQSAQQQLSDEERFPQIFKPLSQHIDRRKCERTVDMKVLVLGMSRTGTVSMWIALQQLGFIETYHTISAFGNVPDCRLWQQAIDAKFFGRGKMFERPDWDRVLGHCQAVCDLPAAAFIPDLIAAYPDAKVVLVERPVDDWYRSMSNTLEPLVKDRIFRILSWIDPEYTGLWHPMLRSLWVGLYGPASNAFAVNGRVVYQKQYAQVRDLVSKEHLYEMRIGEGWEGLCQFLDKNVPDTPFPRTNEAEQFHYTLRLMKKLALRRAVWRLLPGLSIIVALTAVSVGLWLRWKH